MPPGGQSLLVGQQDALACFPGLQHALQAHHPDDAHQHIITGYFTRGEKQCAFPKHPLAKAQIVRNFGFNGGNPRHLRPVFPDLFKQKCVVAMRCQTGNPKMIRVCVHNAQRLRTDGSGGAQN